MNYIKENMKIISMFFIVIVLYNIYFILLVENYSVSESLYINFLILAILIVYFIVDYYVFRKKQSNKKKLLSENRSVYREVINLTDRDIIEHEIKVLSDEMEKLYLESIDLQDYVAQWSHEVKIPLATAFIMLERIDDSKIRDSLREQLENIKRLLNMMLLNARMQAPVNDVQIKAVNICDCINASISNNKFFLIKNGFEMEVDCKDIVINTDKTWLVYILDQLINNAIKYKSIHPKLTIEIKHFSDKVIIFIKDNGEGIKASDIRRIFEKGYSGETAQSSQYKSTGMGLYFANEAAKKIGIKISVESEYSEYTLFKLIFKVNKTY